MLDFLHWAVFAASLSEAVRTWLFTASVFVKATNCLMVFTMFFCEVVEWLYWLDLSVMTKRVVLIFESHTYFQLVSLKLLTTLSLQCDTFLTLMSITITYLVCLFFQTLHYLVLLVDPVRSLLFHIID